MNITYKTDLVNVNWEEIKAKVAADHDGVCNAYIVDVWTYTPYRRQSIASEMMKRLMEKLEGQHLYLFTDDIPDLYTKLGFKAQGTGLGRVVGQWLQTPSQGFE